MSTTLSKYAAEVRTYTFDFSQKQELIAGDTITSVSVTATPSGLTIGAQAIVGKTITAVLASGTPGTSYTPVATITTAGGSTLVGQTALNVK